MLRERPAVVHGDHPFARTSASTLIYCTLCRRSRLGVPFGILASEDGDAVAEYDADDATLVRGLQGAY
jgi:hypothetical protein